MSDERERQTERERESIKHEEVDSIKKFQKNKRNCEVNQNIKNFTIAKYC